MKFLFYLKNFFLFLIFKIYKKKKSLFTLILDLIKENN